MARTPADRRREEELEDRAVYIISVAAELAGVHPQTLRIYERKGLLQPARTAGNTRRYSARDIQRLRMIQRLTQERGLNLAGVKMIVEMEDELDRMRRRLESLDRDHRRARERMLAEIDRLERDRSSTRADILPVRSVRHLLRQIEIDDREAAAGRRRARSGATPAPRGPIPVGPATTPDDTKRA